MQTPNEDKTGNMIMSEGYCDVEAGAFEENDFSPWISRADLQIVFDDLKKGDYFAYVEGRNNGGFQQYRHVTKKFVEDEYVDWAIFWALTQDQFYKVDLKMGKSGYVRLRMQVFEDSAGVAYHQVLWVKPKD